MGSCKSTAKVACESESGSPWLEYQDDNGEIYWYNYATGTYTYVPQECDWYCDQSQDYDFDYGDTWHNHRTGEMRHGPPVAHAVTDPRVIAELQRIASSMNIPVPTATAVPVEPSGASL